MISSRKTISIFWKYTMRYAPLFWLGAVGAVMGVVLQDIIPPLILARTFGTLQSTYAAGGTVSFSQLLPYFAGFTVSMIAGMVIWRLQAWAVWKFEIRLRRDIVVDIYDHLQSQSQRFHADRFGGALVSQTNKFVAAYEKLMDEFIWSILTGVTMLTFSIGVLMVVSYKYAVVLLVISAVYMSIMTWRMRRQMPFNRREAALESKQTAALADAISNMTAIRSFGAEAHESKRFRHVAGKTLRAGERLTIEAMKTDIISHTQTNSFHIIAFLFGILAITTYGADISVLYLVVSYTQNIVNRLWQFGRVMRNINRALGDAAEMTEILHIRPEITDPAQPEPVRFGRGGIIFKDVTFYYGDSNEHKPLFDNLCIRIKPGEKVGLVGHSGGGKTTVTKLLLRFMDIQNGTITIDGQDITRVAQSELRQHIAYVPQEPILFHRTLMENIRYGNLDACDEEVIAVSKMAHAHDFISQLKDGYDTLVGERGVKLSGGQRQRIAIARAMLKNAPILVLDEATSALDSESEALIQDALWTLMQNRTAIVIAHRLSTIQKMDRIIVLEKGTVIEEGSHKELIRKNGVYADMWNRQSGGFIEE